MNNFASSPTLGAWHGGSFARGQTDEFTVANQDIGLFSDRELSDGNRHYALIPTGSFAKGQSPLA